MEHETEDSFDPLAPLRADPDLWLKFLVQAFEYTAEEVEVARATMAVLLKVTQDADSATSIAQRVDYQFFLPARSYDCEWLLLWTYWSGTIICSLQIFNSAIARAEDADGSVLGQLQLQIVLDVIQHEFPRLWDNLWEIREPFLISEAACAPGGGPSLHAGLSHLAVLSAGELEKRRGIAVFGQQNSRVPHLALIVWIYNRGPELRAQSASQLSTALKSRPSGNEFYRSVAHGCTSKDHITAAFLRDIRNEHLILGQELYSTLTLILMLRDRQPQVPIMLETPVEVQLVPWILGAARRELCRGDPSTLWYGNVLFVTFSLLKAIYVLPEKEADIPRLSARQTYALVALMARSAVYLMDSEDSDASADFLTRLTGRCLTLLRQRAAYEASAELRALARHTRAAWQAASDEIARRRLGPLFPGWRHFLLLWRLVGEVLGTDPGGSEDATHVFGALERCGWGECLCSVHKPAHRLRVCRGCWRVAYCGAQCQRSDWDRGGHKARCSG